MSFRGILGNAVDYGATALRKNPLANPFLSALAQQDFGVSELLAGGNTANTGRVAKIPSPFPNLANANPPRVLGAETVNPLSNVAYGPPSPVNTVTPKTPTATAGTAPTVVSPKTSTNPIAALTTSSSQTSQPKSLGYFNGQEYFDPHQLYQDQLNYLDSVYGTNLSQLRQGKQQQLAAYGQQGNDLTTQLNDLLSSYGEQRTQGLGQIGNYYSNLGDIYQSSQGAREADLNKQIDTATGKAQAQATDNRSALQKAIDDYLNNYNQSEGSLATQYQGARDEIGTGVVNDLSQRLTTQQQAGQGVNTSLTPEAITANNSLIAPLQALQNSRFNNPFGQRSGQLNTNPILQYLAALS